MAYAVYILRTDSNTFYTGQTNNLKQRLAQHKNKNSKSAKYMRRFKSFELVYRENYPTRSEAMKREAKIKNFSHRQKEALITGTN
jgi:putative endonuclease